MLLRTPSHSSQVSPFPVFLFEVSPYKKPTRFLGIFRKGVSDLGFPKANLRKGREIEIFGVKAFVGKSGF